MALAQHGSREKMRLNDFQNRYKTIILQAKHTLALISIKNVWIFSNIETLNEPMFQNANISLKKKCQWALPCWTTVLFVWFGCSNLQLPV